MQHHIQFVKERLFVLMQASISFNYMSFETLQCFHFRAVFLYMWYAYPNIFLAFSFLSALFYKKIHIVFLQWKTWYKMSLFINKISLKHINLCYSILINSWFFVFCFCFSQEQIRHKSRFNIIAFNTKVSCWRDRLVDVNERSLQSAWTWIQGLTCWGSTNTYSAVQTALADICTQAIYLLTDGRPDQVKFSIVIVLICFTEFMEY